MPKRGDSFDIQKMAAGFGGPIDVGLALSVLTRLLSEAHWECRNTIGGGSMLLVIESVQPSKFDQQILAHDFKTLTDQIVVLRDQQRAEKMRGPKNG